MAFEDVGWGAPRVHAEFLKLGFSVDERTVSRYIPKRRPTPDSLQRWITFLRNHRDCLAGMDFPCFANSLGMHIFLFSWSISIQDRHP